MGLSRSMRRERCGEVAVFPAETSLGWRVVRHVSAAEAAVRLSAGEWREVLDQSGNFIGCQVLASFKKDEDLVSGATSTSITVRECMLNAGLSGKSQTLHMAEEKRIARRTRFGKPLPPEDAIERAMAKVAEFGRKRLAAATTRAETPVQGSWDAFPEFATGD